MSERYAVYFSPKENSQLCQFGESVLARSATAPRKNIARSTFSDSDRWRELTNKPAHYGFHATLKAPFEITKNQLINDLFLSVEKFADTQQALPLHTLAPRYLSRFLALTLTEQKAELTQLAFSCVKEFEVFRKPLSDDDIKRRQLRTLTTRQDSLLHEYGYPYIAEEFKFHMTLSDVMQESDGDYLEWVVNQYENIVTTTPALDQIAIYSQTDRDASFIQQAVFALQD